MFTVLILEIIGGKNTSGNIRKSNRINDLNSEDPHEISTEQITKERAERLENIIMLLPIVIVLAAILLMCILNIIFLN